MGNRAGRLAFVMVLGALALFMRLAQLQIGQHEVWAGEAARLVRSGSVLPYRRGAILDAEGRVLARDREAYHVVLVYRDFRRGHPLGQVAHARSALEQRPVSLHEALAQLESWALDFVRLSVTELDEFARGAPLELPDFSLPEHDAPGEDLRGGRSADLRYYIGSLLQLNPKEWQALRKARRERDPQPSFTTLVARWRNLDGPWVVEERLRERLASSIEHLDRLAHRLYLGEAGAEGAARETATLEELVDLLERRRRGVEDATANRLFREAAGFWPGRVLPELLEHYVDVDWIAKQLRWDDERTSAWLDSARREWLGVRRDAYALPHLLAEARRQQASPETILNLLAAVMAVPAEFEAALDGQPVPWRRLGVPEVFARLDGLFASELPVDYIPANDAILPLHDAGLRERAFGAGATNPGWGVLEAALGGAALEQVDELTPDDLLSEKAPGVRESEWRAHALRSNWASRAITLELASELADAWDAFLQLRLEEVLEAMVLAADPDDLGSDGRLRFADDRLERAGERVRFVLRDNGSREILLDERPDYEVVYLLTRHPAHYPGFRPRDARERLMVRLSDEDVTPARMLIGRVTPLDPDAVQAQRLLARRMEVLRANPARTLAEQEELARLVSEVNLREQVRGASGVEASFDAELRGTNGYFEHLGLEDVFGRGGQVVEVQEVVHGADVRLTINAELQQAAEWVLEHPVLPSQEELRDEHWFANPVGAIVLLTPTGEVVAAASVPHPGSDVEQAAGARGIVMERTLRIPDFQPPGSVFKPFVAAWALDRLGVDPAATVDCLPQVDDPQGHAGYGGVRCWKRWGHGEGVDLRRAIEGSCNAYFAKLGESYSDAELWRMATHFGFGEETGIRPAGASFGLKEDVPREFLEPPLSEFERRLAGNGLGIVEATPMQVARATVGLATGVLPTVRLVDAVGGQRLPLGPTRTLEISGRSLALVREHLHGVTNNPDGTAYKALNFDLIGVDVAAKTGSADLAGRVKAESGGEIHKHTWVAGWYPAAEPELIFVVFLRATRYTASHTAVHVARQILERPELDEWIRLRKEGQ